MSRLSALLERGNNSFDFIRFAAAIGVIFTHSYPYALGSVHEYDDPFYQLTITQYTTGQFALTVFFMLSGFLVTASMDRSRNVIAYVKARLLRIYPGLIGVVLVTIFVIGPLFTNLSLGEYFRSAQTYNYFNVLRLYDPLGYTLPGVFTTNAYPALLNGSLWTLYYEVLCYGMVLLLWCVRLLRKRAVLLLWVILVCAQFFAKEANPFFNPTEPFLQSIHQFFASPDVASFLYLAPHFASGMVFYLCRDQIVMKPGIVLLGIPFLLFSIVVVRGIGLGTLWLPTFGAYTLFYLASSPRSPFKGFGRYGDFSYGLYIYAPLIHQSMTYLAGGTMLPLVNFGLTAGITLVIAVFSYHLIEKPALRLKQVSFSGFHKTAVPIRKS